MSVGAADITADALTTTSKLSFDGEDVDVNNTGNGANTEENKALTQAATHQALLDVNKELGIKTEEKKDKKKDDKKDVKKDEKKKEEPKQEK